MGESENFLEQTSLRNKILYPLATLMMLAALFVTGIEYLFTIEAFKKEAHLKAEQYDIMINEIVESGQSEKDLTHVLRALVVGNPEAEEIILMFGNPLSVFNASNPVLKERMFSALQPILEEDVTREVLEEKARIDGLWPLSGRHYFHIGYLLKDPAAPADDHSHGFIITMIDASQIWQHVHQRLLKTLILTLSAALGLSIVAYYLLHSYIFVPLERMADAVKKWMDGDSSVSIPVYDQDEIGRVSSALNKLFGRLEEMLRILRTNEERYGMAVKAANTAVWDWNIEKDRLHWGGWSHSFFGTDSELKLPRTGAIFMERVHPEDRAMVEDAFRAHMREQVPFEIEFRLKLFFGGYIWVIGKAQAQWNEEGRAIRMTGAFNNISARKKAEEQTVRAREEAEKALEALMESEERLALALDGTSDGIWDWDIASGDAYYSPRFRKLLGYEGEDERGFPSRFESLERTLHEKDHQDTLKALKDHLHDPDMPTLDIECRMKIKNGGFRFFRLRGAALRDEAGSAYRMAGSLSDITEKKEDERAIRAYQERLSIVLDKAADGIITIDSSGRIEQFNKACERILGYTQQEVLGENISLLVPSPHREEHDNYIKNYIKTGVSQIIGVGREVLAQRKDGSQITIYLAVSDIEIEGRRYFTGVLRDITERKKYEEDLKHARNLAEEATKAKSEFLANMSHEIRTPMNGIIGTASLLSETNLDLKQQKYVETIEMSGDMLLRILNDILDYSKIEAGKFSLSPAPFDLHRTLTDIYELFEGFAKEKGLSLTLEQQNNLPQYIVGDYTRIRQIITNLTSNGLKYTDAGSVTIKVEALSQTGDIATIKVSVIDTGMGIPKDLHKTVFDKFTRVEGMTQKVVGTGLGLAICTSLIDMMGGDLGLDSEVGQGSTFWFTLPLRIANETEIEDTKRQSEMDLDVMFRGHILLVEDVETNQFIITDILENLGCTVDVAGNGQEALNALDKNGAAYDLVFMDCNMPVMNGFEATQAIRNRSDVPHIPIVALTANAFKEDVEKCYANGMSGFVSKPVKKQDLLMEMARWLQQAEHPQHSADTEPDASPAPTATADDPVEWTGFDPTFLDMMVGRSPEKAAKFIQLTLKDAASQVAGIQKGLSEGNAQEMGEEAHALKSVSGQAGAHLMSDLAKQLQDLGYSGTTEGAAPLVESLMAEYALFTAKLESYLPSL